MKFKKCNESGVDLSEYTDTQTCPYCGSDEVDVDNPYIGNLYDGEEFTTECNCRTCGETWSVDWTANFKNREWAKVNESGGGFDNIEDDIYGFYEWLENITQYDSGIHIHYYDNEDGSETVELRFDDRYQWDDEVEAGDKSKEDDAGIQDWMRLLEKKSIKNHWAIDIDEYDGEFIISVRSPNAEDDEEFTESTDDLEKEFTYKGVTITRYDYESLPSPMAASKLDDKTMQRIACDIYDYLSSANWSDKDISKYLGSNLDEVLDDWKGDAINDEFWRYMEKAALDNGMEYYGDMPEGEM